MVAFGSSADIGTTLADCPLCPEEPTSKISISAPHQGDLQNNRAALFQEEVTGAPNSTVWERRLEMFVLMRQTGSFHQKGFGPPDFSIFEVRSSYSNGLSIKRLRRRPIERREADSAPFADLHALGDLA